MTKQKLFLPSTFLLLATCFFGGCTVKPVRISEAKASLAVPQGVEARLLEIRKIGTNTLIGERLGQFQYGWFCQPGSQISAYDGRLNITSEDFSTTFRKELVENNYPVVGEQYAFVAKTVARKAEVQISGLVEKIDINVCFPFSGRPNVDIGNTSALKGGAYMRVTWKLNDPTAGKMLYETTTDGSYSTEQTVTGGLPVFITRAFTASVRNLLADPKVYNLIIKARNQ